MLGLVPIGLGVNYVRDSVLCMYFSHLKISEGKTSTWLRMHTISFPVILLISIYHSKSHLSVIEVSLLGAGFWRMARSPVTASKSLETGEVWCQIQSKPVTDSYQHYVEFRTF
jgi:hypothetical protein